MASLRLRRTIQHPAERRASKTSSTEAGTDRIDLDSDPSRSTRRFPLFDCRDFRLRTAKERSSIARGSGSTSCLRVRTRPVECGIEPTIARTSGGNRSRREPRVVRRAPRGRHGNGPRSAVHTAGPSCSCFDRAEASFRFRAGEHPPPRNRTRRSGRWCRAALARRGRRPRLRRGPARWRHRSRS